MIIKPCCESQELLLYRSVASRKNLSKDEASYHAYLEKGFAGERKFSYLVNDLTTEVLVLHNLLLEVNNSEFQIDTLLILQHKIYLFDVKNFEGDYYIEDDGQWRSPYDRDVKNPLHQLNRAKTMLKQLLQQIPNINISIESQLIFVNSEFHLFNASKDLPIIFPTQLNRFMKKLNSINSILNPTHTKIAEFLLSKHKKYSKNRRLPQYNYEELRKGISCPKCQSDMTIFGSNKLSLVCDEKCGESESVEAVILRSIGELKLLFPETKLTVERVYDWGGGEVPKKTIRKILKQHFTLVFIGPSSYYY